MVHAELKQRVAALERDLAMRIQSDEEHRNAAAVALAHANKLMEDNMAITDKVCSAFALDDSGTSLSKLTIALHLALFSLCRS